MNATEITVYLTEILDEDYDELELREYYGDPFDPEESYVGVQISEESIEDSMFDTEQFQHIIDVLTPNTVKWKLEVKE